ncbi:ABC transporter permease [Streptomyces sp. NPDC058371]|uniref:ABC transporter permease n=1 Tax=Streptomyces sp. NPDC058371 TaxID=3346463 RepID=UPI00365BD28B
MTTLSATDTRAPAGGTPVRLGTLRAMLRLHRSALYVWAVAVAAVAALMLWAYGSLADPAVTAYQRLKACDYSCAYDNGAYVAFKDYSLYAHYAVTFVPLLVALWAGATLTARELETGTAQLAWTQSLSPARWLAAKLAVPAAVITAGTALLVVLHHLMWDAGRGANSLAWSDILVFQANGPTTVALALFGLAAGALTGLLLRRPLPALAVTFLLTGALAFVLNWYRAWFWPAVTTITPLKEGPWYGGLATDRGVVDATGNQLPLPRCGSAWGPSTACADTFDRLHLTGFYSDIQPASHYWPLQLTATGAVLALTALTALAAFRVLKRHTTGTGGAGTAAKEAAV